jgi:FtsZ-binding cell division protein ZapB
MSYRPPHRGFSEKGLDRTIQHAYDTINVLQKEIERLKREVEELKRRQSE